MTHNELSPDRHQREDFPHTHELEMVLDVRQPLTLPPLPVEYDLCQIVAEDKSAYEGLHYTAWDEECDFYETLSQSISGGFFGVEHKPSGEIVASCVALRGSWERHPQTGALGWLVTHPRHTGRGLGSLLAACATNRLLEEGYRDAWLSTEDHRLQAIAIYLKLGWRPLAYLPEMEARWRSIRERLSIAQNR